jgi:acyl-CoA synthetase (AMP-forming)/AMP-acid ligase II
MSALILPSTFRMLRTPFIETLSDLFIRSAQWRGRDELFVDDIDRITGADALDQALRIARAFAENGTAPGAVIAYLCRSSARHAVTWFAAPLSGHIACSLHVRETPERLGQALDWLDARILVHDDDLAAEAIAAIAACGRTICRISLGARGSATADYSDIVATVAHFDVAEHRPRPADIAAIVLSSGTTGKPKGIMHSQKTLLEAAKGGQVVMGPITSDSATLLYMQPSFAAWPIIVLPYVAGKAKIFFGRTFTPVAFLESCERERITLAPLVPTMWRMVFEAGPENYDLSSLTLVSISGEAPAPSDVRQLYDRICRNICCVYLSGEAFTASGVMANTRDLMERGKIGSSGRPIVGGDVRILLPGGGFDDEAAIGETGEIAISGPSLAIGYWKDPELTRDKFRDGWWRSGDLGRLDADSGSPAGSTTSSTPAASRSAARRSSTPCCLTHRSRNARWSASPTQRPDSASRRISSPAACRRELRKSACSCASSTTSPASRYRRRFTGSMRCRPGRPENCSAARSGWNNEMQGCQLRIMAQ